MKRVWPASGGLALKAAKQPGALSTIYLAHRRVGAKRKGAVLAFLAAAASLSFLVLPTETQAIALPAFALVCITLVLVMTLWERDGVLPVSELGAVCAVATAIYSVFPLLAFLLVGMTWGNLSDNRLLSYSPGPEEVGGFAWRHVVYLLSFVMVYLFVRGDAPVQRTNPRSPDRAMMVALVFLLVILTAYFGFLLAFFGVTYSGSYEEMRAGIGLPTQLPYFLQQVSHNLAGMAFVLKQGLLILLLLRSRVKVWRYVLGVWLLVEIVLSVLTLGARTEAVLLCLSAAILYHRLVRPLTLWKVTAIGLVLLVGIVMFGLVRDYGDRLFDDGGSPLAATNEFQTLFGTAFDLYERRNVGLLGEIPWQVYVSDLLMVVPSQLLPFEKWDPSEWYLDLIGQRGTGIGLMFGVISQAMIGLDWVELILRGGLLGLIFATIHRWYARRSSDFWAVMLYVFLCIWSYYTFRSTTFYIVYFVMYRFVPAMLLVRLCATVLRGAGRGVVTDIR